MIQTGSINYGVHTPEWNLLTGTGDRSFRPADIAFDPPFDTTPKVVLSLAGVDNDAGANLRVALEAYDIEPGEFSLRIFTWADTRLYSVAVTWLAHD